MFSEVRQAILPIALRNLGRRGDLERAGLLIESLAKHWRDSKPLELLIVAPSVDVATLRNGRRVRSATMAPKTSPIQSNTSRPGFGPTSRAAIAPASSSCRSNASLPHAR